MTPKVSVVMPAFDAAGTVAEAVRSVLAQGEPSFELLVVDDGSADATAEAALACGRGDPRLRVIRQPNAGPSAARNAGAAEARGRLLAFLDADDRWASGLLARHVALHEASDEVGLSYARVRFYDSALAVPGRVSARPSRLNFAAALGENPLCTTSNLVVRRAAFVQTGGFDATLGRAEDQEWLLRFLATTAWRAAGVDAALVHYRASPAGLSADLGAMLDGWLRMRERVRRYAPELVAAHEAGAEAVFRRYLARRALRMGAGAGAAAAQMRAALRRSPYALAANQPLRTAMTVAGIAASAMLPAAFARKALAR